MRTQVSFLALVPSTYTMVPPSQPSAHVPLHSEACEPVTQPRPRRRDSRLRSLQGLGSGDCPRAEGVVSVGFSPFPPRVLPAPPGSLRPRRELPAHKMPAMREPGGLVPSHLLPVQLSGLGGEGAGGGCLPSPFTSGGGGAQSRARAEGSLDSLWSQCWKSAPGAAAATAAARAAWGGERASPTLRSAGDLNATETVIHHGRSR